METVKKLPILEEKGCAKDKGEGKKNCAEHEHRGLSESRRGCLTERGGRRGWWKYRLLQKSEGRMWRGFDWTVFTSYLPSLRRDEAGLEFQWSKREMYGGSASILATFPTSDDFWSGFTDQDILMGCTLQGQDGKVSPTVKLAPFSSGSCASAHTSSLQSGWQPVGQFASSHTPQTPPYLSSAGCQLRGPINMESEWGTAQHLH